MSDCVFCKIVAGEIPSYQVFADDNCLAFLDIAPTNPGHVLVIPKKHYSDIEAISEEDLTAVIKTVKKVGLAIKIGLGVDGYNIQVNNGAVAGQVVPHLHFHITPRYADDGLQLWPQGKYEVGEAEEVANKIKAQL